MKRYLLLIVILLVACQKKVIGTKETNRQFIDSVFAEMLDNNDSVRLHTFDNDIEHFQIRESEKKALRDCIKLYNHKEKFNNLGADSLSWDHINLLYNNDFKKVGLFYARYKFDSEFINRKLPNYLSKIDSTLNKFSDLKSNCNYAQLYQLKITHLTAKSYYSLALKEMQKLLKTTVIIDNCPDIQFSVYMEMSFMYADLKLFDKSLESAFKALSYATVPSNQAISYSLIGKAYLQLKTPKKGVKYMYKALNTELKDNVHMHNYYKAILFEMYVELNQFKKADALFKEYESSQGFLKYHEYLFCRAKAMQLKKQKNYPEAINYFLRAKSFIPDEKFLPLRIILKDLSDTYVLNRNMDQALFYLNEYQKMEELNTEQQNEDLINEQTVSLKVAENEAELLKSKKKAVEQELSISKKNKTIIYIVIVSIFLLLLTIISLYYAKIFKLKNEELKSLYLKQNNLIETIERANYTIKKTFSIVSHDLRGPFNALMGYTNYASENFDSLTKEEIKTYLDIINNVATNNYNFTQQLLKWSLKQQRGIVLNKKYTDIREIVQKCLGTLSAQLEQKNISVDDYRLLPIMCYCDADIVFNIMYNILSNAVKFNNDNSTITIKSFSDNQYVYIETTDSGVGMDNEMVQKLNEDSDGTEFEFVIKDNEYQGGFGLLYAKELANLHKGKLVFESQVAIGTKVTLAIPI